MLRDLREWVLVPCFRVVIPTEGVVLHIHIPLAVTDRYNGQLAHKMFLTTLETTTRVYVQVWGPKETCHDTLEPIRAGGRGPRGPGGPPGGPRAERSFAKNKKCCNIF